MKSVFILLVIINFTIISGENDLEGYWELINREDGKLNSFNSATFGPKRASSEGLYIKDSSIVFLHNIYYSNLLFDWSNSSKELKMKAAYNFSNKTFFDVSSNRIKIKKPEENTWIELNIVKNRNDTLELRNEEYNVTETYLKKDHGNVESLKFDKISFSSSYCLGNCPVFVLEIDSHGLLKYEGVSHIEFFGKYEYQLDSGLYKELNQLISLIDFESLKKSYFGIMHGPTFETSIYFVNSLKYKVIDHSGAVSCELLWLYNFFEKMANIPFKQKVYEKNIFADRTLKIRKISKIENFTEFHTLDNAENDFILSELLKTSQDTSSFRTKYYLDAYELLWDDNSNSLIEKDIGTIETDGRFFKKGSTAYKYEGDLLDGYFDAMLE